MTPEYTLTTNEVAARLRVSRRTIERMRDAGRLPLTGVRIGRQIRFSADSLNSYISAKALPATLAPRERHTFGRRRRTG